MTCAPDTPCTTSFPGSRRPCAPTRACCRRQRSFRCFAPRESLDKRVKSTQRTSNVRVTCNESGALHAPGERIRRGRGDYLVNQGLPRIEPRSLQKPLHPGKPSHSPAPTEGVGGLRAAFGAALSRRFH